MLSKIKVATIFILTDMSDVPKLTTYEISLVFQNKYRKATGNDDIVTNLLKYVGEEFHKELVPLFTKCT